MPSEVPDSVIHWLLGALVPMGGVFFLFLLKRTFHDFEMKIADLFGQMKESLKDIQRHDTKLQLLDQRVKSLERSGRPSNDTIS